VPDAIVRALELRKGSADLEISSLSADMVPVLARRPELGVSNARERISYIWASTLTMRLSDGAKSVRRWPMPRTAKR